MPDASGFPMLSSGSLMPGGGGASLMAGGDTLAPNAHASTHENGGSDEISVAGLSGVLADAQTAAAHAASHQNGGADEISVAGLSGLLADSQTALAHAASHQDGGSDEISVAGLSGVLGDAQTANTIVETGGPTSLAVGALADMSVAIRSGATFVGVALASAGSFLVREPGGTLVDSVRAWGLATTSTQGALLENTTAATVGATVQYSPAIELAGTALKSNAVAESQTHRWRMEVRPASGAASTSSTLVIQRSNNGAAWSTIATFFEVPSISSAVVTGTSRIDLGSLLISTRSLAAQGLGTTYGLDCNVAASVFHLIHGNRTDGASNIVIASVYDRNAASITNAATMRLHSFGWTNNSDVYTELAAVYCDGRFQAVSLSASGDTGGLASNFTWTNVFETAGAGLGVISNVPTGYQTTPTWVKGYNGTAAGVTPFYPVV